MRMTLRPLGLGRNGSDVASLGIRHEEDVCHSFGLLTTLIWGCCHKPIQAEHRHESAFWWLDLAMREIASASSHTRFAPGSVREVSEFVELALSHRGSLRACQHHGLARGFRILIEILLPLTFLSFHTAVVLNLSFLVLKSFPKLGFGSPHGSTQLFEPCFEVTHLAICRKMAWWRIFRLWQSRYLVEHSDHAVSHVRDKTRGIFKMRPFHSVFTLHPLTFTSGPSGPEFVAREPWRGRLEHSCATLDQDRISILCLLPSGLRAQSLDLRRCVFIGFWRIHSHRLYGLGLFSLRFLVTYRANPAKLFKLANCGVTGLGWFAFSSGLCFALPFRTGLTLTFVPSKQLSWLASFGGIHSSSASFLPQTCTV